ncbi:hypothetical protein [Actinacidiphila cocklensis]|uniref:hypothetical protein n=1 Tax=Actinacidiphila cocklensis TaxID=887465 RepID=UPI0027E29F33|nr:hypothetical protein [Actinacidiphila cocklensis]
MRYEPADRLRLAVLSPLMPRYRRAQVFPITPATLPAWHRKLGAGCPTLAADPDHGTGTFSLDLPSPDRRRNNIRRGGYPTADAARTDLRRMSESQAAGFSADPNHTVADYLTTWLKDKQLTLKPTTHCHKADPAFADLAEVLIGTGIRKGEALALHWDDVHPRTRPLRPPHTRRRRQQPPDPHRTKNPFQQGLGPAAHPDCGAGCCWR